MIPKLSLSFSTCHPFIALNSFKKSIQPPTLFYGLTALKKKKLNSSLCILFSIHLFHRINTRNQTRSEKLIHFSKIRSHKTWSSLAIHNHLHPKIRTCNLRRCGSSRGFSRW
ncbi:hypothetical protein HanOQP8_Chr10g0358541 [Helianthus annuus]|nr:hypothetical protein HanOQP8_Chr10g0358541 [Helianthus annuus]